MSPGGCSRSGSACRRSAYRSATGSSASACRVHWAAKPVEVWPQLGQPRARARGLEALHRGPSGGLHRAHLPDAARPSTPAARPCRRSPRRGRCRRPARRISARSVPLRIGRCTVARSATLVRRGSMHTSRGGFGPSSRSSTRAHGTRLRLGDVVPEQEDGVAVVDVGVGAGPPVAADAHPERRRRGGRAQPGVAVHVRGADPAGEEPVHPVGPGGAGSVGRACTQMSATRSASIVRLPFLGPRRAAAVRWS